MAKTKASKMIYLGGHSAWKGLLGVIAFPEDFPKEKEYTIFYTTMDDRWMQLQFEFDVSSLAYLNLPKSQYKGWWLVGKRGEVVEIVAGKPRIERIATAGTGPRNKYGYLSQIRVIEEELFICGYRRQVYCRSGNLWKLISHDILDNREKGPWNGFESIDGFSRNDIYAVGDEGEIWNYNGKKWIQCDSPTNQNLADIRCIENKVWACGDKGIILCGDKNHWEVVSSGDDSSESLWSIENFLGEIYIASSLFIGKLENGKVVKVDVGIKKEVTSQTLHHKDGILWSIGSNDIFSYDGKKWHELVCPENR